jgi:hypothetical protein
MRTSGFTAVVTRRLRRLVNSHVPARLLRFRTFQVVRLLRPDPGRIPALRGITSRCLTSIDDAQAVDAFFPGYKWHHDFLRNGSICAIALIEGRACAMVWAWIGPGDCTVDDNVRLGFRWKLKAGEAWVHNGEALAEMNGSGVYLSAFQRLMAELRVRKVHCCYGAVHLQNQESASVHKRLGMQNLALFRYVRVCGMGYYGWQSSETSGHRWTLTPSLEMHPENFLQH